MSIQSVGSDAQPKFGWGQVINAHASGLTTGTNTVVSGNGHPMWIGSWGVAVRTVSAGEIVTLQTSSGKVIASVPLDSAGWLPHEYKWGYRVPNDDDIEAVVSGGSPTLDVIVEVMRKQNLNFQT